MPAADEPEFRPFEPSPEASLGGDLMRIQEGWAELGIDADDFLKCGACHRWIRDLVSVEDATMKDGTFLPGIPDSECCTCDDD